MPSSVIATALSVRSIGQDASSVIDGRSQSSSVGHFPPPVRQVSARSHRPDACNTAGRDPSRETARALGIPSHFHTFETRFFPGTYTRISRAFSEVVNTRSTAGVVARSWMPPGRGVREYDGTEGSRPHTDSGSWK